MATLPIQPLTRDQFQAEIDGLADGEELELHGFEYPGPIIINNSITIDGHGATLWAQQGPLCQIRGKHVTLKNFRIEVTEADYEAGDSAAICALQVDPGCNLLLENVEVRGNVEGLAAEEGEWRYPYSIKLGDILHGKDHSFRLRLHVPVPCKVISGVHGIRLNPAMLAPGRNEVVLIVDSPIKDALLLGALCIQTAFLKRQISICGHVVSSAQGGGVRQDGEILYEPSDWNLLGAVQKPREISIPVQKPSVPQPPPPPTTPTLEPKRESPAPPPAKPIPADDGNGPSVPITQPSQPVFSSPLAGSVSTRIVRKDVVLSNVFSAPPPVETDAGSFEPKVNISPAFEASIPIPKSESAVPESQKEKESSPPEPERIQSPSAGKKTHGGLQSIPISGVFGFGPAPVKPDDNKTKDMKAPEARAESSSAPKSKPPKGPDSVPNIFLT